MRIGLFLVVGISRYWMVDRIEQSSASTESAFSWNAQVFRIFGPSRRCLTARHPLVTTVDKANNDGVQPSFPNIPVASYLELK